MSARPSVSRPLEDRLFSDAYLALRDRFLKLKAALTAPEVFRDAPSLSEKTLRALWYDGKYDRRGLTDVEGRPVGVATPGEWNLDEGPDFIGAEIRLGGETLRGDVEIHLSDRDWESHGHHRSPLYNGVILHVFLHPLRPPRAIRRQDGAAVASVCLAGRLPEPWSDLVGRFDAAGYPYNSRCGLGACGRKMSVARYDTLERLLALAGDGRALLKSMRFPGRPEEAFYPGLTEALGYHRNKAPMAALARRLPWTFLKKVSAGAAGPSLRDRLEAVFLGAAGFLPEPSPSWDQETRERLSVLRPIWAAWRPRLDGAAYELPDGERRGKAWPPLEWTFRGVRPANHPCRRLSALADLAAELLEAAARPGGWSRYVGTKTKPADFLVPPRGYFARRAVWGSRLSARPAALVGPDRAQAIWVNVFLPLTVGRARAAKDLPLEKELHKAYAGLRLREPNGTARLMAHRLFGSERGRRFPLTRERQQQGLIQIFQDFCDTKPWACKACVFPQVLDLSLPELERGG